MISSYSRGHKIIYENNNWIWADTKESIVVERPCKKCGLMPTKDGHDACLGHINGVASACCGHGIEDKIIVTLS